LQYAPQQYQGQQQQQGQAGAGYQNGQAQQQVFHRPAPGQ
jgi:hypothetical protein